MAVSKLQLRKHFRAIRKDLALAYREEAAISAAKLFQATQLFRESQHIGCYMAYKDEFNTHPVMEMVWRAKKHCYLPVLTPENCLLFVRYDKADALHRNRYGIYEPIDLSKTMPAFKLDAVLMPLVAFDLDGHRLGTGGGFYDRTFADSEKKAKKPYLIGLAYAAQVAESLPVDPWDINLDGVVTEKKIFFFSDKPLSKS